MDYATIRFEKLERVALITLSRPESLNAVNAQMARDLSAAMEEFSKDSDLWCAVLTGAGDRAFSAGADLKELATEGAPTAPEGAAHWVFADMVKQPIPKPLIAAVNGVAVGGGLEIALACDLIVASDRALFGLSEVKRGRIASGGGLLRLPRQVPLKVALYAILTGEPFTPEVAERWGLVNLVVPHEQVVTAAIALAEKICENSPVAVRASKEVVYQALDVPLDYPQAAWKISGEYAVRVRASEDAKEGTLAFVEKRKPKWIGR